MVRSVLMGLLAFSILVPRSATPADRIEYQRRANWYEGIKPKPVAGSDIELISARADYDEPAQSMPPQIKIRFYLESRSEAYVTVRELDNRYYYWLDKVQPLAPWSAGFGNVFEWPSADVLQQIGPLKVYDLGVVVRLDHSEPSAAEHVAPAILYHSADPSQVGGYLFTFRLNGAAHINASIFSGAQHEVAIFRQIFPRQAGGVPFTVRWDASHAPAGLYRLVIGGWFSDSNQPIDQTVVFFHQPVVR